MIHPGGAEEPLANEIGLGDGIEDEAARRVEDAGDDDLAVRRRRDSHRFSIVHPGLLIAIFVHVFSPWF
jgi:hypothetical protein